MESTLLVIQIVLSIMITIAVLLQKSSGMGLGAYSGSNESLFGAKGPMGFLAKATFFIGFLFVLNTLALTYVYTKQSSKSAADLIPSNNKVIPASQAPTAPISTPMAPKTN
jgi:preprotein translocase subunit SecG